MCGRTGGKEHEATLKESEGGVRIPMPVRVTIESTRGKIVNKLQMFVTNTSSLTSILYACTYQISWISIINVVQKKCRIKRKIGHVRYRYHMKSKFSKPNSYLPITFWFSSRGLKY